MCLSALACYSSLTWLPVKAVSLHGSHYSISLFFISLSLHFPVSLSHFHLVYSCLSFKSDSGLPLLIHPMSLWGSGCSLHRHAYLHNHKSLTKSDTLQTMRTRPLCFCTATGFSQNKEMNLIKHNVKNMSKSYFTYFNKRKTYKIIFCPKKM